MKAPDRAPRKPAGISLTQATGVPVPGANAQTYQRKTASVSDSDTYMKQRNAGKTGVTPQSFPDTKVSK